MKQVFLSTTTEFKEIDTLESGTWINMVNPSQSVFCIPYYYTTNSGFWGKSLQKNLL